MEFSPNRARTWLFTAAAAGGIALGATGIAAAATNHSPSSTSNAPQAESGAPDPANMTHGPNETLLTGTTAEKVKAAALKAVPGATVIRVETDSEGSPYEAHLRTSDGSEVTVKVDKDFKVTATQQGFGGGPGGHRGGDFPANGGGNFPGYGYGGPGPSA